MLKQAIRGAFEFLTNRGSLLAIPVMFVTSFVTLELMQSLIIRAPENAFLYTITVGILLLAVQAVVHFVLVRSLLRKNFQLGRPSLLILVSMWIALWVFHRFASSIWVVVLVQLMDDYGSFQWQVALNMPSIVINALFFPFAVWMAGLASGIEKPGASEALSGVWEEGPMLVVLVFALGLASNLLGLLIGGDPQAGEVLQALGLFPDSVLTVFIMCLASSTFRCLNARQSPSPNDFN